MKSFLTCVLLGRMEPTTLHSMASDQLISTARKNLVLVRVGELLLSAEGALPFELELAVAAERKRVGQQLAIIRNVAQAFECQGGAYVLPKAFLHYPDMGHDVDIIVANAASTKMLRRTLALFRGPGSFCNRVAGKNALEVGPGHTAVEIHQGRLGQFGEHALLGRLLLERRQRVDVAGVTTFVASREDELLLQAIQRMYMHRFVRVSDVIRTHWLLANECLDWRYLDEVSRKIGISRGLTAYLRIVRSAVDDTCHCESLSGEKTEGSQRVYYPTWTSFEFAVAYADELVQACRVAEWRQAIRICSLPIALAIWAVRHVQRSSGGRVE